MKFYYVVCCQARNQQEIEHVILGSRKKLLFIFITCRKGNRKLFKIKKANSFFNGYTALQAACQCGHLSVIEILTKHYADLELDVTHLKKRLLIKVELRINSFKIG